MEAGIEQLYTLAEAIGIARRWWDVNGTHQTVTDASLAAIATALGYPAESERDIARSLERLEAESRQPPAMIVTEAGQPTPLPASIARAELTDEHGLSTALPVENWMLPPVDEPGYYQLSLAGHELTLAVAPKSCPTVHDFASGKLWGPAVQIPALRGAASHPFGNFGELDEAVQLFAARGADVLAINPVHALFPGNGQGFSPYSPSSRLYLNTAMGAPELLGLPPLPERTGGPLIDWKGALPRRLADLRKTFAGLDDATRARIVRDNAPHGESLQRQALFDALDVHFRARGADGWQDWPAAYHDPDGPAVAKFAAENRNETDFHLFAQWLAREGMTRVQADATRAGMAIGLLADLAVGVHTGGADSWSMRDAMLQGLTIGAPPDPLGPHGQNWMLTGFSPQGLGRAGYAPWIATLRSALDRAGGLRIDHAFGLARLWLVPAGEDASAGAYLTYPFKDMIRLVALEAHRAHALIVAEDLGTMPMGFAAPVAAAKMLGMRVLWFERAADKGFIGGQDYAPVSVAMTGTHDTTTVAGWWTGRDLEWAEKLGRFPAGTTPEEEAGRREEDRGRLWATLTHNTRPRPAPDDPEPVVDAALRHIGRSASQLAIAPLEDLLAEREQPNLPGTITEHPNWRRRLDAPLAELLDKPDNATRIETLDHARKE
ncbi:4-alpha-glucanotransferase [Novosphingobium mangrovi (ex Huang et al. 2023)]|uniref:4-alpha-glucanotransferase n=1 Tax=Novosphingobium mangrovi (ex Huang et al. 2023) TaxID=2976432 RepID=A0ABT2I3H3_9SPHN|nr:4-alpha-glucanotransferase [Novosphingobium mangrovi (ex Huang et al. 2023)]MCT2399340.1 4-alpha-glucanotransferase [Novosphingobium mangrovi (ex Huang et al. 2023)]